MFALLVVGLGCLVHQACASNSSALMGQLYSVDTSTFSSDVFPRIVVAVTAASPVLGYLNPHSILSVQRMLFLVRFSTHCSCSNLSGTDAAVNPTYIHIPPYAVMSYERGTLASNFGLLMAFAFVVLTLAFIAFSEQGVELDQLPTRGAEPHRVDDSDEDHDRRPTRAMSLWECLGWYHFPGVLIVPVSLLLQPTVRSLSRLLVDHSSSVWTLDVAASTVAAVVITVVFAKAAFLMSYSLFASPGNEPPAPPRQGDDRHAPLLSRQSSVVLTSRRPDERSSLLASWLRQKGVVTPVGHWTYVKQPRHGGRKELLGKDMFLRRYGKLFTHYDGGRQWMLLLECSASMVLGLVEGAATLGNGAATSDQNNVCAALQWLVLCVCVLRFAAELLLLPFALWSTTALSVILGCFEVAAAAVILGVDPAAVAQWHVVHGMAFAHIVVVFVAVPLISVALRIAAVNAVSTSSRRVAEGSRVGGEVFDDSMEFLQQINTTRPVEMTTTSFVVGITRRATSNLLPTTPRGASVGSRALSSAPRHSPT